jgi:hypothetical protein
VPTRRGGTALPFHRSHPDPPADPNPGRARALERADGAQDQPSVNITRPSLPKPANRLQSHFSGRRFLYRQRRSRYGKALDPANRASRRTSRSAAKPDLAGPPDDALFRRLLPWCLREHLQHAPAGKRFC